MDRIMMSCNHVAHGVNQNGQPTCVICFNTKVGESPNLEGRTAKCTYCKTTVKSDIKLPFFGYMPDREKDDYYCGCRGWD